MNLDPFTPAYLDGMEARRAGKSIGDNPYPPAREEHHWYVRDEKMRSDWREGWYQDDAEEFFKEKGSANG
jgi:hypothetical protein